MSERAGFGVFWLVLGLLTLWPVGAQAAEPPAIPGGWSDGYVYANGVRLHYYRAAAAAAPGKPVIVMVHGVTDNGLCWTTLSRKLQDAYDIYMLDTRGHGLSDPFTSDDRDTLVKDVVEFIGVMKFQRPILIGHSMGAATVMRIGAEHPDLAKAIIMLDPRLSGAGAGAGPRAGAPPEQRGPAPGERRGGAATTPATQSAAGPGAPGPAPQAPDRLSISMFAAPETLVAQNNYSFDDLVATCRRQHPKWDMVDCQYWALSKKQYHGPYTSEARQAMSGTMQTGDALARITVPALILKADAPPEQRKVHQEAASVMQNGRLVHVDGGGHNLHHDELHRTVELLSEFLSAL